MMTQTKSRGYILVIEDERDFAELIASVLRKKGYEVAQAHNIEDALKCVQERTPDLITLDLQMPAAQRQCGLHFYRCVKSNETYRQIPIVVITGVMREDREMEGLVRSFLEIDRVSPPDAYIDKPFENRELIRVVAEALAAREPSI